MSRPVSTGATKKKSALSRKPTDRERLAKTYAASKKLANRSPVVKAERAAGKVAGAVGATAGAVNNNIMQGILHGQQGKFTDPSAAARKALASGKASKSLLSGMTAGAKAGSKAGGSTISKSLSSAMSKGAKTGGKTGSAGLGGVNDGGSGGGAGYSSIYDGLDPNTAATAQKMASSGASSKTLAQYIKDANKDLGKGTDYSALGKQLATDSKNASTNVGTLYKALQTGIRGNDATIKKIYDDSAKQTAAAGGQSQSTISAAYDQARSAVQDRASATGATVSAADTANATGDEANAVQRSAQQQQNALTQNSAIEANSRRSNVDTASAAGFQGAETQAGIAQSLADNQAKLKVQQSTEDTQRRQSALQYALQMQGSDRDYSMQSQQLAQAGAQNAFSNQLALANAKLGEANAIGDNQVAQQNADTAQAKILSDAQNAADKAATAAAQSKATAADAAKSKRASLYVQLLKQYNGDDAKAKQALKALGY